MDHFSFLAPFYEKFIQPEAPTDLISLLELTGSERILDAGGGTGRVSQYFLNGKNQVVLADFSFAMLLQAVQKPGLMPLRCPTECLPFANQTFDRIIMVDTLHHVENQAQTAAELWRVLKVGGKIIIKEPDIRRWLVKGVALVEKLLLMRSHIIDAEKIASLFRYPGANIKVHIDPFIVRIVVKKQEK